MSIQSFPSVRGRPREIALFRQRVRGRAQTKHVEQQSFVVALPAVRKEPALRRPAVRHRYATVPGPVPVDAAVEVLRERSHLSLESGVLVEVGGGREGTCEQDRRIDRRQLAPPGAAAGFHVEKVIVEASVAGRIDPVALGAVRKETERCEGPFERLRLRVTKRRSAPTA